jgi:hypothetical protein
MNTSLQRSLGFGKGKQSEEVTVTTSIGLTVPTGANSCLVSITGANVRWRVDGVNPTTTVGHILQINQYFEFFGDEMKYVRFIAETGTAKVFVTYYF